MRFLGLLRADAESEAGAMPTKELMERMGTFMEEVAAAGVLEATDGLKPSSEGKRVKLENGDLTVTDGPFTESKELVASYAIFNVASMDEAVHWTQRFLEVLGTGECELRPIFDPSDFPPELFSPEEQAKEAAWREEMERKAGR
ncbi:MAG TPA: YciI family protein [Dehalococcoidia bacterium]|jgi:hypothetical protein|nr:YciI family protein [Dehalococcoidia bacterium]